jgi:hypothetical protein
MRRAARVDRNQAEVDEALEVMGWLVWPTSQLGNGFPDRVIAKHGRLVLLEVKDGTKPPSKRALTEDEARCHELFRRHGIHIHVVESLEDLQQLDRHARAVYEGIPERNMYEKPSLSEA